MVNNEPGVFIIHKDMPGSDDKTGMREKDLQITHNLHAMNNYLISGFKKLLFKLKILLK